MTLYEKIISLYPELTPQDFSPINGSIILMNEGSGDFIHSWKNKKYAQPTDAQLKGI